MVVFGQVILLHFKIKNMETIFFEKNSIKLIIEFFIYMSRDFICQSKSEISHITDYGISCC
ncbi:hypothetical protein Xentx_01676 [Xenorhabdus thuongxuanensis]|uniref:Uncharacterized protein n=1 Tax=Xenorhabdus thuongxuanensis TaxID=1873484 RepID=A0A1Q5U3N1_9GAMM|nr:hypothetical protein Xentx_01676 [Xenorhabdus thuongxuanensis]